LPVISIWRAYFRHDYQTQLKKITNKIPSWFYCFLFCEHALETNTSKMHYETFCETFCNTSFKGIYSTAK